MEIIVEVGTTEQQELIRKELEIIKTISGYIKPPLPIRALIVPKDFDSKINGLQGTTDYKSVRANHSAAAKIVNVKNNTYLVFSPILYTKSHDFLARLQTYVHEFLHAVNKRDFMPFKEKKMAKSARTYIENLYILFDEYDVDRKSLEIIGNVLSQDRSKLMRNNSRYVKEMIRPLIADDKHYNAVYSEITKFRFHGSANKFLDGITPYYDEVTKILIHSYAIIDHYPKFSRFIPFLVKSKFVTKEYNNLIDFFRMKYKANDPNLMDGIPIMSDFMKTFGIEFSDTSQGTLYCRVCDI